MSCILQLSALNDNVRLSSTWFPLQCNVIPLMACSKHNVHYEQTRRDAAAMPDYFQTCDHSYRTRMIKSERKSWDADSEPVDFQNRGHCRRSRTIKRKRKNWDVDSRPVGYRTRGRSYRIHKKQREQGSRDAAADIDVLKRLSQQRNNETCSKSIGIEGQVYLLTFTPPWFLHKARVELYIMQTLYNL